MNIKTTAVTPILILLRHSTVEIFNALNLFLRILISVLTATTSGDSSSATYAGGEKIRLILGSCIFVDKSMKMDE